MRVLVAPEVYRPSDAVASGTLRDAIAWVDFWLEHDPRVHVYWLLPPRSQANYERADLLADRERVTLLEAEGIDAVSADGPSADEPRTIHVAGSLWAKKHVADVLSIGRTLSNRYGIETVLTSMESIPDDIRAREWLTAYPNADRETYESALHAGDIAVCASEYETMPRTPFEQAASGQVLLLRDEPWVAECVPADHPLVVDFEDLGERATWAVEHWETAVDANRRLVEYTRRTRRPAAVGERTYEDRRTRIDRKRRAYDADDGTRRVVERVLENVDGGVALDAVDEQAAAYTDEGRSLTANSDCAYIDVVYALRSLGYADTGAPGTPRFEPVSAEPRSVAAKRT